MQDLRIYVDPNLTATTLKDPLVMPKMLNLGSVIGSWIFNSLGIVVNGSIGYLAMATVGAVVLVGIVHLIRSPSSQH